MTLIKSNLENDIIILKEKLHSETLNNIQMKVKLNDQTNEVNRNKKTIEILNTKIEEKNSEIE